MADEDRQDRLNRELIELLNELRVALPGVQMLFAFMLTVPFSQRFATVTTTQRNVFYAAFLCTAVASACLIAPSAQHRIEFRNKNKDQLLKSSNRLAIVGTVFLALAISLVVYVITDVLFGGPWSPFVLAVTAALFAVLWFVLPLVRGNGGAD